MLALGLAVAVAVVALTGGGGEEPIPPPDGPALRLGGLAGEHTVGLAARRDSLQVTALQPDAESPVNVAPAAGDLAVRLTRPGGAQVELETRSCGPGCRVAAARLAVGVNLVEVAIEGRGAGAVRTSFRVPWPLGPGRGALLRRAVAAMARVRVLTVRERSTSNPALGFSPSPTLRLSGRELVEAQAYDPRGAQDARELPGRSGPGVRVLAYALPTTNVWYQVWIGRDGLIHRQRVTTPNHLILDRFSFHEQGRPR